MNIETKRLVMRALEPKDAHFLADMINDPETRGVLGAYDLVFPMSVDLEERWIETVSKSEESHMIVTLKKSSSPLGILSVKDVNKRNRSAHLSIIIKRKECNKGYGTEAISGALDFMFNRMNMHRIWLRVAAENGRALACYKKCGFTIEGTLRDDHYSGGSWRSSLIMAILQDEFRKVQP